MKVELEPGKTVEVEGKGEIVKVESSFTQDGADFKLTEEIIKEVFP